MIYLLDTNACIRILNGRHPEVLERLAAVRRQDVALCSVVKTELYYGAYRSSRGEANLALLEVFFREFAASLPLDDRAADRGN